MPYILFNTHLWHIATSQGTCGSQHASCSRVPVSAYLYNDVVWTETVSPSDAHIMPLSALQTTTCRLLTSRNEPIALKLWSISSALFCLLENTVNQMDKSVRAATAGTGNVHYATAPLRLLFLFFHFFLPHFHSNNQKINI